MLCVICEIAALKQQLQLPRMLAPGIRLVRVSSIERSPQPSPA
jgi:uncharacterized protein YerC